MKSPITQVDTEVAGFEFNSLGLNPVIGDAFSEGNLKSGQIFNSYLVLDKTPMKCRVSLSLIVLRVPKASED